MSFASASSSPLLKTSLPRAPAARRAAPRKRRASVARELLLPPPLQRSIERWARRRSWPAVLPPFPPATGQQRCFASAHGRPIQKMLLMPHSGAKPNDGYG
eukprot:358377-Chlamydomonas_euryale.AAC.8